MTNYVRDFKQVLCFRENNYSHFYDVEIIRGVESWQKFSGRVQSHSGVMVYIVYNRP